MCTKVRKREKKEEKVDERNNIIYLLKKLFFYFSVKYFIYNIYYIQAQYIKINNSKVSQSLRPAAE